MERKKRFGQLLDDGNRFGGRQDIAQDCQHAVELRFGRNGTEAQSLISATLAANRRSTIMRHRRTAGGLLRKGMVYGMRAREPREERTEILGYDPRMPVA